MTNVVLVGCGNMGFAMLTGWLRDAPEFHYHVVEPNDALRQRAGDAGARVHSTINQIEGINPSLVVLAVKPQVMADVVPAYQRFADAVFVSVAAGTTVASLRGWLGDGAKIVRTMPNTPAAIGQGMLVSYATPIVPGEAREMVSELMATSGRHAWIDDEGLMDAVTAISGSGPAYLFHFIECLGKAARQLGLSDDLAQTLAIETVAGAAALAKASEQDASELRVQVTSPGGTTAAALDVLMADDGLSPLVERAATAARDRGVALGAS